VKQKCKLKVTVVEISSQTDDVLDSKASPELEVKFQELCKGNNEKFFLWSGIQGFFS